MKTLGNKLNIIAALTSIEEKLSTCWDVSSVWRHLCRCNEKCNICNLEERTEIRKQMEEWRRNGSWSLPLQRSTYSFLPVSVSSGLDSGQLLVHVWEREDMEDSSEKLFFNQSRIVRVALALECGRAGSLQRNKGQDLFWFCWLFSYVLLLLDVWFHEETLPPAPLWLMCMNLTFRQQVIALGTVNSS